MWSSKRGSKGFLHTLLSFAILIALGQSVATFNGTQTLTLGPTLTTTVYGATLTVQPTTTVLATLPAGGSMSFVSSGVSTNSYYVYSTTASSLDSGSGVSLCFDCCLWPCIRTGLQASATPVNRLGLINRRQVTSAGNAPGTCPTAAPGTRTTTLFTTSTTTRCDAQPVCPNPGWGIIGQSNIPGASTVYTSNSHGATSFIQIPTSTGSSGTLSSAASHSAVSSTAASASPSSSTASPTYPSTSLPTCPASGGTVFTDYYGSQYRIECDTVFTNNIISTQNQTQLSDCITACDSYSRNNIGGAQCKGASWISGKADDNCLLFDGNTTTPQTGTFSATLITGLVAPPGDGGNGTSPTNPLTSIGSIITPTAIAPASYTSTEYGVSTAVSTYVSNGQTYRSTYGVTTAISQHVVNRLVTTVTETATTVSVSLGISYIVSYIISTAAGATQTLQLGAGATVTLHDGPTVTSVGISTIYAGPTYTTYGGTLTVTTTAGTAGVQTVHDVSTEQITTTAPTVTTTVYTIPPSSSSSSYCRPFPTEYLHGKVPVRRRDQAVVDGLEGLVDIGSYAPMIGADDKPRAMY